MAIKRSYSDACAAAHALDLVGERWALLIVRELLLGPKRFTDLRAGLAGLSPNVLTQRLNELETASVVRRRKLPVPANAWVYELSDWGRELEPIIHQLARWGVQSPAFSRPVGLGIDAMMLSLRTMFDPDLANGYTATIEISLAHDQFTVRVDNAHIDLSRGSAPKADARLKTDPDTLVMLAYGKADLDQAIQEGALVYTGKKTAVKRFLALFRLPGRIPKQA